VLHTFWQNPCFYFPVQETPGPQVGTGSPAVAAWWLGMEFFTDEETEAAAAPATTTESARTRKASFISGYPLQKILKISVDD